MEVPGHSPFPPPAAGSAVNAVFEQFISILNSREDPEAEQPDDAAPLPEEPSADSSELPCEDPPAVFSADQPQS